MKSGIAFSGCWKGPKLLVQRVTSDGGAVGRVVRQGDEVRAGLRRGVRRPGLERVGLERRAHLDRAVDLVGADVEHALDLEVAGRVQHHVGAQAVRADELVGPGDRAVDVALGREVDDGVVARHGGHGRLAVADVALHEREPRVAVEVGDGRAVPGVGEEVVHGDRVVGGAQHVAHVVRADEAGAAGDEDAHDQPPVRSATCGRRAGSSAPRPGLSWSRFDRIGSVTPQSASTAGSSHARPSSSAAL